MKYLFILGRNSKLSIAEIKSFCKRVEVAIIGSFEKNNGLLLEVDKKIEEKEFEKLGELSA
jgi:tRNA G10  N-methylase Trm11